ncbi:PhoH family protein [Calditerrivibrio nitroreducens]|uniref:PhoH family protein n=1 Tax=Calditerrivibrio nitroreducens (strain DSM 19672 / NBRC 101217 / Yu37-1) TaxID=768670 RepID=E4TG61_CALNY|nr:PhoH family protein [Calditerrivibrio nitroreducens]ADR19648.1 PhoH family protein [Calditerrivibrio nitroreducens DSM 19672]
MINYVFDTNVILYDPKAINAFDDAIINIPIMVIEEIDNFKKNMDQTGYNARFFARVLDELRKEGDLKAGVMLPNGSKIRVNICNHTISSKVSNDLIRDKADNLIISVAIWLKEHEPYETVFVTKDANLRIKADVFGIKAIDYTQEKTEIKEFSEGTRVINVADHLIDKIYKDGIITNPGIDGTINEYVRLDSEERPGHSALVKFDEQLNLKRVSEFKDGIWGIFARNAEQRFAFDALMDDNIKLVSLAGISGTGKTLLAVAAGLKKVVDDQLYKKLLVSRPIFPMGKDLGYLPGELKDKINPWMQPVYDNLNLLLDQSENPLTYRELFTQNMVEIEALTYIRGRSIPHQFFIVDEAQNLTPHEIKTILTRAGENTKIVLTGDPNQIDNPYIDFYSNGLSYVIERFKNDPIAAAIYLTKGERSLLASKAAEKL